MGGINGDMGSSGIPPYGNILNCINAGFIPKGNSMYGDDFTIIGLNKSINVGVTQRNMMSQNCFFDKQMFLHTGLSTVSQGKLTNNKEICGTALQPALGDAYIYETCLYPRLKNMPIEEPGYVAASPVFLRANSTSYDTYDNIRYCFKVSNKYGVKWRCKNGKIEINNNTGHVRLLSKGEDTLYAYLNTKYGHEAVKTIPINIVDIINDGMYGDCDFALILKTNPEEAAILTGEGQYETGEKAIYKAVPNKCYRFIN